MDRNVLWGYTCAMSVERILQYLRALRDERGLDQPAVAGRVGVDRKQIGRWERGENQVPFDKLFLWVQGIGGQWVDFDAIVNDPLCDPIDLARRRSNETPLETDTLPHYNPLAGLTDDEIIALADRWNAEDREQFRHELLEIGRRVARLITGRRPGPPDGERPVPRT
jgi:transcriptional regulator with XRE-family HTH domain